MKIWLPDVSEHQLKIDWDKLAGKIPGAIIRIGYGDDLKSQDDIYALYNMQECKRLNIPFAVYLYSYASSTSHIKSEIRHMQRMIKGFNPIGIWLDLEQRNIKGIWKEAAQLWLQAFGEEKAGVYSWQWAFEQQLKGLQIKRWIAAYGTNDGTRQNAYKPTIDFEGWQFTSRYKIKGISGNVDFNEWKKEFGTSEAIEIKKARRVVTKKEIAALIMAHLCTHKNHGYTQEMTGRQGTGTETINIYGVYYTIPDGDRDCSSAVISAYRAAGIDCGQATYTGNMKKEMTGTGNFAWRSMNFVAQMGDTYLNEKNHTAMCMSSEPDVLAEFSINEKGTANGGKIGDQLQSGEYDETYGRGESHLKQYYDYPWDGILQCINEEIAFIVEADGTITEPNSDDGFTAGGEKVEIVQPEKTDTDLAVEILFDVHGSGDKRRKALGGRYDAAQAESQRLWNSQHERTQAEKAYMRKFGCKDLI